MARASAARSFTRAFPLAFTSRIASDALELTVRVDGSVVETRRVARFAVADACESPHDRCTSDFAMAPLVEVDPDGDRSVDLRTRITGVPPGVDTLAFTLDGRAEFRPIAAEADCQRASAQRIVCRTSGAPAVTVGFPLFLTGDDHERVVTLSLELPAQGHRDSDPSTPTSRQSGPLRLESDFAVGLQRVAGEDDRRDVFRLRGNVTGIPADADRTTLRLAGSGARFEFGPGGAPAGCSPIDAATGEFACDQLTGDLDFDVVATLDPARTEAVVVTLSLAVLPSGYTDPDASNNSASVTLPAPPPPYLVEPFVARERGDPQTYHVEGAVGGLPEGADVDLVFAFERSEQRFVATHDDACELSDDGGPRARSMTCRSDGAASMELAFDAWIPGSYPSATLVLRIGEVQVDTVAIRFPYVSSAVGWHGHLLHGHLGARVGAGLSSRGTCVASRRDCGYE
jgi:hypothetical protein